MKKKLIMIDNYDSFTYNLYHLIASVDKEIEISVFRNDKITVNEIRNLAPSWIILSPGPCTPKESGVCLDVIREMHMEVPILGVCLGHQAIGEVLGGATIERLDVPMHGKISKIKNLKNSIIFDNVPEEFEATRYHSLVINGSTLSNEFIVTSETDGGVIMSISHIKYKIHGIQFHPESICSEYGEQIMQNFLNIA